MDPLSASLCLIGGSRVAKYTLALTHLLHGKKRSDRGVSFSLACPLKGKRERETDRKKNADKASVRGRGRVAVEQKGRT